MVAGEWYGRMHVLGWQFWMIGDLQTPLDQLDFSDGDRIVTSSPDLVAFVSACDYAYTGVRLILTPGQPDTDHARSAEWERTSETEVDFTDNAHLRTSGLDIPDDPVLAGIDLPPGRYRVRAHVRGQERQREVNLVESNADLDDPRQLREQFLIEVWPADSGTNVSHNDEAERNL